MQDKQVLNQISNLVDEEHELLNAGESQELTGEQHDRLKEIQVSLDQCWDLLRRRRAKRGVGEDPNEAHVRDASTVERYLE
jgi:hypothetical protein